jgi:hypothetical protein
LKLLVEDDERGLLAFANLRAGFGPLAVSAPDADRRRASMVPNSDDPDQVRRSKDSANRVLTMVKALLNHALRDP